MLIASYRVVAIYNVQHNMSVHKSQEVSAWLLLNSVSNWAATLFPSKSSLKNVTAYVS